MSRSSLVDLSPADRRRSAIRHEQAKSFLCPSDQCSNHERFWEQHNSLLSLSYSRVLFTVAPILPKNLAGFERHRRAGMVGDHSRRKFPGRTIVLNAYCIYEPPSGNWTTRSIAFLSGPPPLRPAAKSSTLTALGSNSPWKTGIHSDRIEDLMILFHPSSGGKLWTADLFGQRGDFRSLVNIVEVEARWNSRRCRSRVLLEPS